MSEILRIHAKRSGEKKDNMLSQKKRNVNHFTNSPVDRILYLQRTAGNQAVSRLMRSRSLQAKLRIGQPGDVYEQEADRVADAVMRMPEPGVQRQEELEKEEETFQTKPLAEEINPLVQRQVEPEEEEKELQAKSTSDHLSEVTPNLESHIQSLKGGGQPLSESDRAYFEPRFDRDFSGVRVHTDMNASESAKALKAKAYTVGQDIVFGAGQYAPAITKGKRLLAHELTHMVQQTSGVKRKLIINHPTEKYEREVDQIAQVVMQGKQQITLHKADEEMMRRQTKGERKEEENFSVKTATLRIPWTNNYDEFLRIAERDVQDKLEIPPDRIENLMGSSNLIDVYMQIEYEKRLGRVGKTVKIEVRFVPVGMKTNRLIFYWPRIKYKEVESVILPEEKRGIIAQIYFAFDLSLLDHKDKEVIGDAILILKKKLKEKKARDVIVKGYTDVIGTRGYNLDLSERRAKEVADILKSSSLADTGGLILEVGLGEQGTDKDTEDIRSKNRRVDISYFQPTYNKPTPKKQRWGGRPGSRWAPVPWTRNELETLKAGDQRLIDAKKAKDTKKVRMIEQDYFMGEQVIKNWNNRYGKWNQKNFNEEPWALWFCHHMSEPKCRDENYIIKGNPKDFWKRFLEKSASSARLLNRKLAINPFFPEKDRVLYLFYKDELERRDPTSLEFNKAYEKYINPKRPYDLVDPPEEAQKFVLEQAHPMNNEKLKEEISRLEKRIFSQVRLHSDAQAAESARALNAKADGT